MTLNLEYNTGTTQYMVFIVDETISNKHTLTISKIGDGNTEPETGTTIRNSGEIIALNAIPDLLNDWRFENWTINGVVYLEQLTAFEINKATEAIAKFIKQYNVKIESGFGGNTEPIIDELKDIDTVIDITSEPDEHYEFDKYTINGVDNFNQDITINVSETLNILSYFKSLLDTYYQEVFGTDSVIQKPDGKYYIQNKGEGVDADTNIENVQVLKLDGVGSHVDFELSTPQNHKVEIDFTLNTALSNSYPVLFAFGGYSYGLYFKFANNFVSFYDGSQKIELFPFSDIVLNQKTNITVIKNGVNFEVILNGISKKVWTSTAELQNNIIINGDRYGSPGTPTHWGGEVYSLLVTNTDTNEIMISSNFQEQQGTVIKDFSGNGNDGTLINANLTDAWSIKSDNTQPDRYIRGYNKSLVCETFGTSSILASPDGSNVGNELVVNGDFSDGGNNWNIPPSVSIINEQLVYDGSGIGNTYTMQNINSVTSGKLYKLEFDIKDYTGGICRIKVGNNYNETHIIGKHTQYIVASTTETARVQGGVGSDFIIDNISVKEVQEIPAYGEWIFDIDYTYNTIIPFISDRIGTISSINGYEIQIVSNYIRMIQDSLGSRVDLIKSSTTYIPIGETYKIKIQRNQTENQFFNSPPNWFRLLIKGGIFTEWTVVDTTNGIGTNPVFDDTHVTSKFIVVDIASGDEITQLSKDSVLYNMSNFIDDTGSYNVRYDLSNNGLTDIVNGNDLQYLPFNYNDSEEILVQPNNTVLNNYYDSIPELNVLRYPNKIDYRILNNINYSSTDFSILKTTDNINNMKTKNN